MSRNIDDFVGDWYVWWVAGEDPVLHKGWKLAIGPVIDDPPSVSFILSEPDPEGGWRTVLDSKKDGPLVLVDGSLRWDSPGGTLPADMVRIYISLAEAVTRDDTVFFSLYGTTLHGDPEQVAVWGANDTPP